MSRSGNTKKLVALFVAVAAASAVLGIGGTLLIKSPAQVAADTAPPRLTVLTATVSRGAITNTLFLAGTVALGNNVAITPKAPMNGSDAIVTKVPVPIGGAFGEGSVVVEISDRPLIVLASPIPLIRDLSVGMTGEDVERFQEALRGAGLKVGDKSGSFGPSTAAAVKKLYQNDGYAAPKVGAQVVVSQSEIALVPMSGPGEVTALGAALGGAPTGAVVTVTTLPPVVSATVNPADAVSLRVGMTVDILIDGVSSVGSVSLIGVPVQNGSTGYEAPVSVTSGTPLPPTSVGTTAQISVDLSKDKEPGLKVPLSAVYSNASGGTSVTLVTKNKLRSVPVTVAKTGDGFAQITVNSGRISAGDKVRVGTSE